MGNFFGTSMGSWFCTGSVPATAAGEDFTTYTEVDPTGVITVLPASLTATALPKDIDAYIYKDFTADYWSGDFTHTFDVMAVSGGQLASCGIWGMANSVDDYRALDQTSDGAQIRGAGFTLTNWILRLALEFQGYSNNVNALSYNTQYYCTMERDDDGGANSTGRYVLSVYDDEDRTSLVGSATVDANADKQLDFRYLYSMGTYNMSEQGEKISIVVSNLTI